MQVASFGPLALIANADMPGGQVDDRGRNEKRRNLARAAIEQAEVLALDDIESANAGSDVNPNPLAKSRASLPGLTFHGFIRGRQGKVNEAAHFFQFFFFDELQRIEVLDFSGDLAGERRQVFSLKNR